VATTPPLEVAAMTVLADFDWSYIWEHRDELRHGLRLTLEIAAIGIAGSFVVGLTLGAARAYRIPVISQLAAIYVELIRNTPILVQIFLLFFGLPRLSEHLKFEPFTYAWLAVVIWGGAFNTENYRAGFEAVPARYRGGGGGGGGGGSVGGV
jgi:polar amino acid transport system permease protein